MKKYFEKRIEKFLFTSFQKLKKKKRYYISGARSYPIIFSLPFKIFRCTQY